MIRSTYNCHLLDQLIHVFDILLFSMLSWLTTISQLYRWCIHMYGGSNKHCYETTDLSHGIAATSVRLSGRWRRGLIVTACGAPGQRLWQVSSLLYTPRVGLASVHWQPVSRPLWQRWPWKRAVTWARLCVWLSSAAQLSATASQPAAHCYSALSRVAGFPAISSSTSLQPTLLDLTVARGESTNQLLGGATQLQLGRVWGKTQSKKEGWPLWPTQLPSTFSNCGREWKF